VRGVGRRSEVGDLGIWKEFDRHEVSVLERVDLVGRGRVDVV
jgi:hypothetical protein